MINLRKTFLEFFEGKNHLVMPSSPVIPHDDPSILFINSGMAPFKNYFLNPSSLPYSTKNLTSIQKCIRAGGKHNDLEEVGYTKRHHTFFEMCGNFSFGGYAHETAISMAWEFLTEKVGLQREKLYITVHPEDQKSFAIWKKIVSEDKISFTKENEWSMGDSGPCGMCTEIFYDHGGTDPEEDRVVEIWNLVFMTHQINHGIKTELEKTCVDTGMGLERLEAILAGTNDNYRAPLFRNLIQQIESRTNIPESPSHRIIADHARSILFMISDGILPDTTGRGYVLRRILRRAIRHQQKLGDDGALEISTLYIMDQMKEIFPEIQLNKKLVLETIKSEIEQFSEVLIRGMHYLDKMTNNLTNVDGKTIFKLYDTYGLPVEIIKDTLKERAISYNIQEFEEAVEENRLSSKKEMKSIGNTSPCVFIGYHQAKTQTKINYVQAIDDFEKEKNEETTDKEKSIDEYFEIGTEETVFYPKGGGQESDRGIIDGPSWALEVLDVQKSVNSVVHYCKMIHRQEKLKTIDKKDKEKLSAIPKIGDICYLEIDNKRRLRLSQHHSATHLLLAALRKYLGDSVVQKGSLVSENRLRFDFLYNKPIADLNQIEKQVNFWIEEANNTELAEMSRKQAEEAGAVATFGERYGEKVRVVKIGESMELCGGTHVENSASIGSFYILSERSISASVRRIEAVAGIAAYEYARSKLNMLSSISKLISVQEQDIYTYLEKKQKMPAQQSIKEDIQKPYLKKPESSGSNYDYLFFKNVNRASLLKILDQIQAKYILLANRVEEKTIISIKSRGEISAKELISFLFAKFGAKFGGGKDFAEGALESKIEDKEIIEQFIAIIEK